MMGLRMFKIVTAFLLFIFTGTAAVAVQASDAPYAGQDSRNIKALSAQDIEDLLAGRGWGFAKPAELNGFPGPAHLLELKDRIALSDRHSAEIPALFDEMQRQATALGAAYVAAERALEDAFAGQTIVSGDLAPLVMRAAELKGRLRLVHLETHLKTLPLLSKHQVATYMRLRGYAGHARDGHQH